MGNVRSNNILFGLMKIATQQQAHNRLSNLSHKQIKLPRLNQDRIISSTRVLQLIKTKKSELLPCLSSLEYDNPEVTHSELIRQTPRALSSSKYPPRITTSIGTDPIVPEEVAESEQNQQQQTKQKQPPRPQAVSRPMRHKTVDDQSEMEQYSSRYEEFKKCLSAMPLLGRYRNVRNMEPLVTFLIEDNHFFRSIQPILISSLLKVCCIRTYSKSQQIYRKSDKLISLYIILWGKARVSDLMSDFRRTYGKGETLCEHILFSSENPRLRLQNAKALTECTLLQIPIFLYRKIFQELTLYGYRNECLMMETIIRRNYIEKQSNRPK